MLPLAALNPPRASLGGDDMRVLALGGDPGELRGMSDWLKQSCAALGIAPERAAELELAANEMVTNIISYGYDAPGSRAIELRLERAGAAGRLTIEDDARPFDPLAAALPEAPDSLADAGIGGLGIKLVRGMMADCNYRRADGRNVFTMTTHP